MRMCSVSEISYGIQWALEQLGYLVSFEWINIIHLVLSSLGFTKHVIYHAIYILQKNPPRKL